MIFVTRYATYSCVNCLYPKHLWTVRSLLEVFCHFWGSLVLLTPRMFMLFRTHSWYKSLSVRVTDRKKSQERMNFTYKSSSKTGGHDHCTNKNMICNHTRRFRCGFRVFRLTFERTHGNNVKGLVGFCPENTSLGRWHDWPALHVPDVLMVVCSKLGCLLTVQNYLRLAWMVLLFHEQHNYIFLVHPSMC